MAGGKRAAGFIVYRLMGNSRQYLLMQASNLKHHWSPPKGHLDPGEDDLTAALRETREESGLNQEQLTVHKDFQDMLQYEAFGAPKTVVYMLARLVEPDAVITLSHEHQDFKWLEIEDACFHAEYKDLQNTLQKCHQYLENLNH